jgi:hypothetical protein
MTRMLLRCSHKSLSVCSINYLYLIAVGEVYPHMRLKSGRELFPYSDCLRSSAREWMLLREILTYSADIVCLQARLLPTIDIIHTILLTSCGTS